MLTGAPPNKSSGAGAAAGAGAGAGVCVGVGAGAGATAGASSGMVKFGAGAGAGVGAAPPLGGDIGSVAGISNTPPHLHLARLPAISGFTLWTLLHDGHWTFIDFAYFFGSKSNGKNRPPIGWPSGINGSTPFSIGSSDALHTPSLNTLITVARRG